MEVTYSHYYDITFKLSSLTGMWPYLKPRTKLFRITLLTIIVLSVLIPQIAQQYICKTDLQCTSENLSSSIIPITCLVMLYTFLSNNRTFKVLTHHLFVDWKELRNPEEFEIMKLYAENSRRFALLYSVYCTLSLFLFLSLSLIPFALDIILPLNESRPIVSPYPANYFVDVREHFFKIYWHSILAWEIIIIGIITYMCMYVTYIEHVCSIFATIGFRIEYLFYGDNDKGESLNFTQYDTFRERIALMVNTHQKAIELAQLLEDAFNIPYGIYTLIVTGGMSVTLLQITKQNSTTLETTKYVLYVISQLFTLLIPNFEGQKLIDHSLQTHDKIYNSYWYRESTKSQKLIMLMMMKSLQPCCLSVGKIYILSMQSFSTILKASVSYFTMLASFQ
ncbi:hypothetical protein DMN91_011198 [Ooceraea biroi]|nr:hypothetical protein X777_03401 [Ooceraea biroi]RLU17129.1 hypothetical protein DMN91_011198 [Ooceraea biroi]